MISIAQPIIGEPEIEAVVAVLRSGQLAQGEVTARFEQRFADLVGARHAIAVSNGTAALHAALLAHGIGPGDEVITSPFSFIATGNSILYCGARPVFADISPDTYNLDPAAIEARITPRTRAIMPVHLYGHPADMPAIEAIAARHGLTVIEDACQAHGAAIGDRAIGQRGTATFSFYATKNVMTAEGGIVTTDDDGVADRLRLLRSHGQRERYKHEMLGYNYRLTDLQAAIGLAQLDRLDELTASRIANAAYLSGRIDDAITPTVRPGCRHVYHQYVLRVRGDREDVARRLASFGVGSAVHYPVPIHRQPLYRQLGYQDSLPIAERASREVLSLPVHPALTVEDLDRIASAVEAAMVEAAAA
jgi:dTDP-4-amino-4,6-dideoxygalactose transaminase